MFLSSYPSFYYYCAKNKRIGVKKKRRFIFILHFPSIPGENRFCSVTHFLRISNYSEAVTAARTNDPEFSQLPKRIARLESRQFELFMKSFSHRNKQHQLYEQKYR